MYYIKHKTHNTFSIENGSYNCKNNSCNKTTANGREQLEIKGKKLYLRSRADGGLN